MSIYEILPALDLTQTVHAKISIGMHRGVKFKISRIPLIGLETRLGWRTDKKFLRNPNLNEIRWELLNAAWQIIYIRKQQHRYKAYSAGQTVPSTAQIRAEGNNTKCVGKKRFNGSATHGLRKEHVLRPPFWTR